MTRRTLLALTPALMLPSCSSPAPEKKEPAKPVEPITGLHALYQMYTAARAWAQDLQILRYASINIAEVQRQPGKTAAWQVVFVSQALRKSRVYTFSVYEASATLHQGLFPDAPQDWSGNGKPFLIEAAKIDTDAAWETALKHGADYNKKNPWRVIWGQSAGESSFSVLVDASTGEFVRILH
jgi:hypothetical protein